MAEEYTPKVGDRVLMLAGQASGLVGTVEWTDGNLCDVIRNGWAERTRIGRSHLRRVEFAGSIPEPLRVAPGQAVARGTAVQMDPGGLFYVAHGPNEPPITEACPCSYCEPPRMQSTGDRTGPKPMTDEKRRELIRALHAISSTAEAALVAWPAAPGGTGRRPCVRCSVDGRRIDLRARGEIRVYWWACGCQVIPMVERIDLSGVAPGEVRYRERAPGVYEPRERRPADPGGIESGWRVHGYGADVVHPHRESAIAAWRLALATAQEQADADG